MRHLYECPMRWADLDMLGHVNNVVYVDYLQEARVDMLRTHARSPQTQGLAEGVVVVSHQVTYVAPLLFDFKPVYVESWVTEIRAASFTMAYEIFREAPDGSRTVFVRASTVLAPYVFATESPRRLRPEEKTNLEPYLEPYAPGASPKPLAFGEPKRIEDGHFPLHVRFSDVDAYGHVNNVKYFEYFQESRVALMQRLRSRHDLESWSAVVVAQTDVVYQAPVLARSEPYDVWSQVSRLGTKSMTIESEIADGDQRLARGRVTLVFYDLEAGKAIEPSPQVRAAVESIV
ncbi:acyl-CoA thioester hydrolase [Nocardioides albertanoniae]|uniref:Acyl-CoA thioester hydrolase n=1 Tax=Nocardioides albertanoniae TaxID=1175486 RepID=A0A543ABW3_9ACTN|nr:thioesterase family protein [Nocardioides albertanoniae]TQL70047.1 acyl-CoA thioester hydrolase [Nocardioides albertanoniae]